MSDKFQNKYTIESIRLKSYDYSQNGMYFVTICTKNRENFLGEIINKEIKLSVMGEMAKHFWQEIENLHDFIVLDEMIIMPNHIHGIICIQNNKISMPGRDTPMACLYKNNNNVYQRKFGQLQKHSIASIINHYKGITKKWANKNQQQQFAWQKNYYDHIIHTKKELTRIREHIFYNPVNWETDRNNKINFK